MGLSPNLEIEAANTGENQMLDRWATEVITFLPKPTLAGSPVLFYRFSNLFIGGMIQTIELLIQIGRSEVRRVSSKFLRHVFQFPPLGGRSLEM